MQVVVSQKSGKVLCVHAATGSCHDFQLFKQSRLPLARALKVLTDSGYQGIKKYHQNSEIPTKSSKHKPLDKEKREYNRQVASQRIGNEHAIGFIKRFRMVAGRYRNRLRHLKTVRLCTARVSLKKWLRHFFRVPGQAARRRTGLCEDCYITRFFLCGGLFFGFGTFTVVVA